ncbi:MAG: DUF5689 domain-containing protein [Chitinophaga sp.]
MKRSFLYLAVCWMAIFLLSACRKTEDYKFSTGLAIDSRIVRLGANADTTQIIVYADGEWSVEPEEKTDWMSLQSDAGNGKGSVLAEVTDNNGQLPRAVKLIVRAGGKTDTISLQQSGLVPKIAIADTTLQSIANGGALKTAISTNVPLEKMTVGFRYEDAAQSNWLKDVSITDGYLFVKADSNKSPNARACMLSLSYLDALGATTADSVRIVQHPGMSFDGAMLKDLAYIKSLPSGTVTENIYIEGVVISDKGHPNIAKNLNKTSNKHTLDKTENAIAVYVQSMDGTTGLYLKMKTAGDNIFSFNDHVKIWLGNATITQLSNPGRAVVSGVEATWIMQKESSSATLQPREKYIGELTDNDLYTYVKLKDVEISVPSGAFTNINEGYTARLDCYPTHIRDIQGNSLYMLTNLDVPYRRDGMQVPQGSGTIAGVLVSETMDRFGGDIGQYAIRHLKREDIALQQERSSGFSNVLVEWSRFKKEFAATPTTTQNPLTPDVGEGLMFQSAQTPLNFTSTGIYATSDYNGLLPDPTGTKGAVSNGAWASKNWWNTAGNSGEYWGINISTAGISTPISLQLEGNSDIGGPRNFVVEWSADNSTFNTVGEFTFQDIANWSNTLLTQVPAYKTVNFNFPPAASGLPNLYIRVRVADKTAGTTTSPTGGTVSASKASRLAHVSVKYNK